LSGYGTDNSANLDAIKSYPGRFKAIAGVDPNASEKTLEDLRGPGVVGVRFNLVSHDAARFHAPMRPRLLQRMKAIGWFAQIYADDAQWPAAAATLRAGVAGCWSIISACDDIAVGTGTRDSSRCLRSGREGMRDREAFFAVSGLAHDQRVRRPRSGTSTSCLGHSACEAASGDRIGRSSTCPAAPPMLTCSAPLSRWLPDAGDRAYVLSHNPRRLFGFGD
jgi:hypothetical protein